MDKLGFTFYPQDWWSSDSFFDFDAFERYVYLECLFIMYRNGGYMKTQKTQFENRIRISVSEEIWTKITGKFLLTDDGFTSLTVNKRLVKAAVSRENGKLGGRPPKGKETQKTQTDNLKRKGIEIEREVITHGEGKLSVTVRKVFANDSIHKIHDLKKYFEYTGQIETFGEKGWVHFEPFMGVNAGKVFNEPDHLYNTFRNFCIEFKPPMNGKKYQGPEQDKELWTLEAWEKQYGYQLKNDNDFRTHFGYEKL